MLFSVPENNCLAFYVFRNPSSRNQEGKPQKNRLLPKYTASSQTLSNKDRNISAASSMRSNLLLEKLFRRDKLKHYEDTTAIFEDCVSRKGVNNLSQEHDHLMFQGKIEIHNSDLESAKACILQLLYNLAALNRGRTTVCTSISNIGMGDILNARLLLKQSLHESANEKDFRLISHLMTSAARGVTKHYGQQPSATRMAYNKERVTIQRFAQRALRSTKSLYRKSRLNKVPSTLIREPTESADYGPTLKRSKTIENEGRVRSDLADSNRPTLHLLRSISDIIEDIGMVGQCSAFEIDPFGLLDIMSAEYSEAFFKRRKVRDNTTNIASISKPAAFTNETSLEKAALNQNEIAFPSIKKSNKSKTPQAIQPINLTPNITIYRSKDQFPKAEWDEIETIVAWLDIEVPNAMLLNTMHAKTLTKIKMKESNTVKTGLSNDSANDLEEKLEEAIACSEKLLSALSKCELEAAGGVSSQGKDVNKISSSPVVTARTIHERQESPTKLMRTVTENSPTPGQYIQGKPRLSSVLDRKYGTSRITAKKADNFQKHKPSHNNDLQNQLCTNSTPGSREKNHQKVFKRAEYHEFVTGEKETSPSSQYALKGNWLEDTVLKDRVVGNEYITTSSCKATVFSKTEERIEGNLFINTFPEDETRSSVMKLKELPARYGQNVATPPSLWTKANLLLLEFQYHDDLPPRKNIRSVSFVAFDENSQDSDHSLVFEEIEARDKRAMGSRKKLSKRREKSRKCGIYSFEETRILSSIIENYQEVFLHLLKNVVLPCNEKIMSLLENIVSVKKRVSELHGLGLAICNEIAIITLSMEDDETIDCEQWKSRLKHSHTLLAEMDAGFEHIYGELTLLQKGLAKRTSDVIRRVIEIRNVRERLLDQYTKFYWANKEHALLMLKNIHECTHVSKYTKSTIWHSYVDIVELRDVLVDCVKALMGKYKTVGEIMCLVHQGLAFVNTAISLHELENQQQVSKEANGERVWSKLKPGPLSHVCSRSELEAIYNPQRSGHYSAKS